MTHFIDRRLNPKGKSLGNRQRFLRRAKGQIKEAVAKSLRDRSVKELDKSGRISIPAKSTAEPRFRHDPTSGRREHVHPGNKEFAEGDRLRKPPSGQGGGGKDASDSGDGEDNFSFTLTQEEFLDIFFEDLELPNLVKTSLKQMENWKYRRAGMTSVGSPTNMNLLRTMRNAHGRRLALGRPSSAAISELKERLFALEMIAQPSAEEIQETKDIITKLEELEARRRWAPYIDPLDVRFNAFEPTPVPTTAAVMFCLMDVSGSMGEREKDLAKRFYMLLYLFLKKRYEKVEVVFIRHTHHAEEVDEETFFYSRQSGGTIVSTAIEVMQDIQRDRFPTDQWNIYVAQASDGYTQSGDAQRCVQLLNEEVLPILQYYAYIEILDEREMDVFSDPDAGAELWRAYRSISDARFAQTRIASPKDIFPVFRELFAKDRQGKAA
ncbi:YeaH/YhbH family protein [Parvularcula sp. LCG005]|uniref:YeaH/YhbH family protein n=1 Tax=Parvularcula sp. LCG005 TaxID=3078805 RepID=UPI002942AB41|nr:YeaH/YhbH family protein [Parvularcula sp. LCG005]WOI52796.1 YeaH/YhbH family protein [Parvularcula sp. LCG005]